MIILAHLSDTHFDGSERSVERASRVMSYVNDLPQPVDAVLVTGDIAHHGLAEEYADARKVFTSSVPVFTCPGNHDERAAYREVLLDEPADASPVNHVFRVGGAVFAMCDSTIPGHDDGVLADETLAWLAAVLAETPAETPVFVCFHHPPVALHNARIDAIRLFGEQRLAELIADHPQVVATMVGHAHTAASSTFAGRPLLVAPGVASTLLLPWESDQHTDPHAPPGLAFHILDDDHRLTTHFRTLP